MSWDRSVPYTEDNTSVCHCIARNFWPVDYGSARYCSSSFQAHSGATRLGKRVVVVSPELRLADNPAAAVLRAACGDEPISRDEAARATGSSIATVNRQVSALLNAGLLRERADFTASGAVGRPRRPFEVDHEPYATVGIHIGAVVTAIVVADLRGRILGGVEVRTPSGPATESLTIIARSALAFASRWHRRRLLCIGVALGGRVDSATGAVDHPGWSGRRHRSPRSSVTPSGCRCRCPTTSRRWPVRSCC